MMNNPSSTLLAGLLLVSSTVFMPNLSAEETPPLPRAMETLIGEDPDNPKFISTYYKDLDEDGVSDAQDQCLNSGKGYPVNRYGCELDSDDDGIYDRFDQCPKTEPGIHVNFLGCESDEDLDRVLDSQDQCPDTPLGTPVDAVGCNNDLDQDGVVNAIDQCPNTPLGTRVNRHGCKPVLLVITHIVFDTGSYAIREDQKPILEQDFSRLSDLLDDEVLLITGHTDNVGTAYRNLKLSWNRAQSTKDFFVQDFEVSPNQVYVLGKGEAEPSHSNKTPEGRQQNRRIELKIIKADTIPAQAKSHIPPAMKGYQRWGYKK